MYLESLRKQIADEFTEEVVVLNIPSFDKSIIGVSTDNRVVYDYSNMIKELSQDAKITEEEAEDFINYNTLGSLLNIEDGKRPIIMMNIYQGEQDD